ncbi:MAG: hypothetical protein ACJA0Q_001632 [Saprospiraceae bacterium]
MKGFPVCLNNLSKPQILAFSIRNDSSTMRTILFIILLSAFTSHASITVSGVTYATTVTVKNDTLQLNGAGVREKWFLNLYTGGLYLKKRSSNVNEIIDCNCLQVFKIVFVSSLVTTKKFNDAIDEVFIKSTQGNTTHIDKRIAQFKKALGTGLKKGDELFLIYVPNVGLQVFRNNKYKDTVVGLDFKKEMMKLWIGPYSVNEDLKKSILGLE